MHDRRSRDIATTEVRRWLADVTVVVVVVGAVALAAGLTFLAVTVAAGGTPSGQGSVQLQTDSALTTASTSTDLASMAQSAVTMVVPLIAAVVGAHLAGVEMRSGALLHMAVAARRLRLLFLVRALLVVAVAGTMAALVALAAIGAADSGSSAAGLRELSVGDAVGPTLGGSAATAVVIALLTFALAALTRRSLIVLLVVFGYLIVIEPILVSATGDAGSWLPRSALTALLRPDAAILHAVPSALTAVALSSLAIARLHRGRAA